MYRRNLSAAWTSQPGELKADECIEDIFAGGDGWGPSGHHASKSHDRHARGLRSGGRSRSRGKHEDDSVGERSDRLGIPLANGRGAQGAGSRHTRTSSGGGSVPKPVGPSASGVSGRASLEQHANNIKAQTAADNVLVNGGAAKPSAEVDELAIRDDLRSWIVPSESKSKVVH